MKKKLTKKRLVKIVIIILLLIIALIGIMIIILKSNATKKDRDSSGIGVNSEETIPMYAEEFFNNYNGEISKDSIYRVLTQIAYYIIDNKSDIDTWSKKDMQSKYDENSDEFKKIGIIESQSFIDIMNIVKNITSDDLSLSYIAFENKTFESDADKVTVDVSFKYVGIDEFRLKLTLAKDSSSENPIKIEYEN